MRYIIGILCLVGSIALLYAGLRSPAKPPTPDFTVDTPVKDFGEVEQMTDLYHTFTLTNTHPAPVEVLDVTKSCGCTVAEVSPKIVPPGGTAELKTVWKVGLSKGDNFVSVGVTYSTGGGVTNCLNITKKARVTPAAWVSPEKLTLVSRQESSSDVTVCARNGTAKIVSASADTRFFEVTVDNARQVVSCRYNGSGLIDDDVTYNVIIRLENVPGDLSLPISFRKPVAQPTREGDTR